MTKNILVTGATGTIGREVTKHVAAEGRQRGRACVIERRRGNNAATKLSW